MIIKTLSKFIFLTGIRDKLFIGLLTIILAIFAVSNLIGFTALTEEAQMQLTYFAFLSRIVIICGMILFICFYINKEFENREIEFILSKNISRNQFIISYLCTFNLMSLILLCPVAIIISIFNQYNFIGLIVWLISVLLENTIISTFAIVSSLILKSAIISIFSTLSFYVISRMMGFFVYTLTMKNITYIFASWQNFTEGILKILSSVFPRLDLFGKTEWLIYGITDIKDIYILCIQSFIYIILMLLIAFYDFNKKEF